MSVTKRYNRMCNGAITNTSQPHGEELIPVDTNEPTEYVSVWDVSRTANNSVRAYLTGTTNNYELHFYGYGDMINYGISGQTTTAPWASYLTQIKKIQAHDGVTGIGFCACRQMNGQDGTEVVLSNTVRIVRQLAFIGMRQTIFTLPNGIRTIRPAAFSVASANSTFGFSPQLTEVDYSVPNERTSSGTTANWLATHTEQGSFLIVGDGCVIWGKPPSGTTVTIPEGVKCVSVRDWLPANVTKVNLPSTCKRIALSAFANCQNVTSVKIPQGTERIEGEAFRDCTALRKIWIPRSVWRIATNGGNSDLLDGTNYVFNRCSSSLMVYCEIEQSEVPDTWANTWNNISDTAKASVVWGYAEPTNW